MLYLHNTKVLDPLFGRNNKTGGTVILSDFLKTEECKAIASDTVNIAILVFIILSFENVTRDSF